MLGVDKNCHNKKGYLSQSMPSSVASVRNAVHYLLGNSIREIASLFIGVSPRICAGRTTMLAFFLLAYLSGFGLAHGQ